MTEKVEIKLQLTKKQAELLAETLSEHCDRGPLSEGYQSDELFRLSELVESTVNEALKK